MRRGAAAVIHHQVDRCHCCRSSPQYSNLLQSPSTQHPFNMKTYQLIVLALALIVSTVSGFGVVPPTSSMAGGSSFVVSQSSRPRVASTSSPARTGVSSLQMGSMAKFGVFSPAVYAAKIVLGGEQLNKVRGKAISLHSQYIGEFCEWAGAYHLRTKLIKKAKTNGDILGFLV
jgi:hypothetical protein